MVYTLQTVIKFGKYKGSTIQETIDDDAGYIEWAIDIIDTFELDEEAIDYLYQKLGTIYDNIDYDHQKRYGNSF